MNPRPSGLLRDVYELLSSMRFAISLLVLVALASVAGTLIKQNEPYNNYLNQFGPFWFDIFERLGLYSVYHAPWFILILFFLVTSTGLCVIRQSPLMLREMRNFREQAKESSLRAFAHHRVLTGVKSEALPLASTYLTEAGFRLRINQRDHEQLIAGKAGQWNRVGYILAHSAIIFICVGGLFDGDLPLQLQLLLGNKQLAPANALMSAITPANRLDLSHTSYRGNVFIPEGQTASKAVLNVKDGILLQDLPFNLTLEKFYVDFYSTGMPKRFASDVIITDLATGEKMARTIEVNKPISYKGVTLYQASFDDGGSQLKLRARSLTPGINEQIDLDGVVGESIKLTRKGEPLTIEVSSFRPINVENLAAEEAAPSAMAQMSKHLGAAGRALDKKGLTNVGPSIQYKLRDAAGQAREFHNYAQPVLQDGRLFFISGMRENPNEGFRYMRIPTLDGHLDQWMALRAVLTSEKERAQLARRFTNRAMKGDAISETMRAKLTDTAENTLGVFAQGGYEALDKFIREKIPEAERQRGAEVFVKVLQGVTWEAMQMVSERSKTPLPEQTPATATYITDSLNAISDSFQYGAPFLLELKDFTEIKASVIQATRSPGQKVVYLGCALLVAGVFFMLYIRERRVFLLLKNDGTALFAMSSNRKTLDLDEQFDHHAQQIAQLISEPPHGTDPNQTDV